MSESGESATERRGLSEGRRLGWLAALFAAYALITGLLVRFKLIANGELAGGRKYYSAPFTQVMCTIDWAGAVVGLCALVIASLLPPQRRIDDLVAWLGRRVWLVALVVIAVCALLSLTVHQAYPLTADEFAPYFQSQVFARGRIVGQWPPALVHRLAAEETRKDFLVASRVTGQICSGYWPGHAMLMTPFTAFGMPWLYNPLLAGLAILLIAAVARRSFGEPAVGWAVLFTIASPVFAAYGISFYAMMSHLVLNLLFVLLLSNPTVARVAAAGLVGGCALVLHNPFPHAAFALPWLIWLTVRSDRWTRLPVIAICYAAVFLPIDAGWRSVEEAIGGDRPIGIAAAPADQAPQAAGETTGVAPAAPPSPPASGIDVVGNTMRAIRGYLSVLEIRSLADIVKLRLLSLMRLVAWDAPGLVLIAALGFWRCRRLTAARLLACSALTTFLGYGLIAMSGGHGWGYRYFFSCWGCLPLLAAGLAAGGPRTDGPPTDGVREDRLPAGPEPVPLNFLRIVGLAAALAMAVGLPVRLWQIHGFISNHLAQLPPKPSTIAMMPGETALFIDATAGYFRHDLIRNDPFLEKGPFVFASQGPDADAVMIQRFAESSGLRAKKLAGNVRGSTWVLERGRPLPANE